MGTVVDNKFTWLIENFTSLKSEFILSNEFVIGGCKWCLIVSPEESTGIGSLSLYLAAGSDFKAMSCGWRRHVKYRLTVVNQLSDNLSQRQPEREFWFDQNALFSGYADMIRLNKLHATHGGFLVNNQVKIVAEVDVLRLIGKLDVSLSNESQAVTQLLKMRELNYDNEVKKTSSVKETIYVNGFQVLPTQVNLAKRVFEIYPEIEIECRTKYQNQTPSFVPILLRLIQILFKSPRDDASTDDLSNAEALMRYIKNKGFKLDWLEKKLDQVKENKKKSARVYEMEQQLNGFRLKCKDLETKIHKEKAEILEATTSHDLYFSDVLIT